MLKVRAVNKVNFYNPHHKIISSTNYSNPIISKNGLVFLPPQKCKTGLYFILVVEFQQKRTNYLLLLTHHVSCYIKSVGQMTDGNFVRLKNIASKREKIVDSKFCRQIFFPLNR